jgi:hypothetical protein
VGAHDETSVLDLPGTAGAFISTPHDPSLALPGDISIRFEITPDDPTPAAAQIMASKWQQSPAQMSWLVFANTNGTLQLRTSADGSADVNYAATSFLLAAHRQAYRCDLDVNDGAGNRVQRWYVAPTRHGPWSLVQTITTAGATTLFANTIPVVVGARSDGTVQYSGLVHAFELRDAAGTVVTSPDCTAQNPAATSFVDDNGRTWTLQGAADLVAA